jgi:hypothetical protein
MKDHIYDRYGNIQLFYFRFRAAILETWKAIPIEKLENLIRDMCDRCQAVIDMNKIYIKA